MTNNFVSVVVDEYSDTAKKGIMRNGKAKLINSNGNKKDFERALYLLREKLSYYRRHRIDDKRSALICVMINSVSKWNLPPDSF
jgi:hypothetical protein